MGAPKLEKSKEYERLLATMKPAAVLKKLREEGDTGVSLNTLYQLNKRSGQRRWNTDASETVPWPLLDRHLGFATAIKLRDLARLMQGQPLAEDPVVAMRKARKLGNMIVHLRENDLVIDYNPVDGFVEVPRRYITISPGVTIPLDTGWIRDPSKGDNATGTTQWIAPEE